MLVTASAKAKGKNNVPHKFVFHLYGEKCSTDIKPFWVPEEITLRLLNTWKILLT